MFLPNQKVVCIDDTFSPEVATYFPSLPKKGDIYTIRDIIPGVSLGGGEGEVAVYLIEIVGSINPHGIERGFNAERFAPLEEIEDEVFAEELASATV